jgi:SAM-dependent methyltransferase
MRYYDPQHTRLTYYERAATPEFWDLHWQAEDFAETIRSLNRFVIRWTRRHLPPGSRVLEGGCGRGQNVYSLQQAGYEAYGVDFAIRTVALVRQHAPELRLAAGDVRHLPFADGFFDGYWSLGVIEHFYEGYGPIMGEMARVLRRGGRLFLTFPHMSPLRKVKARLGMYPPLPPAGFEVSANGFYQFALDAQRVSDDFTKAGFQVMERTGCAGLKGFKDEAGPLKPPLQRLYDNPGVVAGATKLLAEPLLRRWCGHSVLLILRKT